MNTEMKRSFGYVQGVANNVSTEIEYMCTNAPITVTDRTLNLFPEVVLERLRKTSHHSILFSMLFKQPLSHLIISSLKVQAELQPLSATNLENLE